jgi:hypothetical protein
LNPTAQLNSGSEINKIRGFISRPAVRFMAWCLGISKGKVVNALFLTEHHTIKAYWGNGGITPRILQTRHYMEVSAQLHAPAALHPGKDPMWMGG